MSGESADASGAMEAAPAEPSQEAAAPNNGAGASQVVPELGQAEPPAKMARTEGGGDETAAEEAEKEENKTSEGLEVVVPASMLGEDECKLCEVKFLNPDMAHQHYGGKKHAAKETAYIRSVYEEKGIDPTRFLPSLKTSQKELFSYAPSAEVGTPAEDVKNPVDLDKYHFSCFLCGLHFERYEDVERHVKTPTHAVRIWEYQQTGSEDHRYTGSARLRALNEEWPEDFRCKICDKELNSPSQYEQHILSKNHLRRERILAEGGDPRMVPNDRSGWQGPPMGGWGGGPGGGYNLAPSGGYGGPPRGGGEWRGRGRGGYGMRGGGGYGGGPPRGGGSGSGSGGGGSGGYSYGGPSGGSYGGW